MVFNGKAISQVGIGAITNAVSTFIARNSASIGGESTSDGVAIIATSGVCWSSSPNPIKALLTKMTETFPHTICALSFANKYFVRPDSTNALGTAYGNETVLIGIGYAFGVGTIPILHQSTSQSYIAGENHGWIAALTDLTETPQLRNNSLNTLISIAYGELSAWFANQNRLNNKQI